MKNLPKAVFATALLAGSSAALAEVSGNVALTTDYIFRGISQTSNLPAIQGGLDYTHDSGFYAGVWASNVDFDDANEATIEIDYYAGLAGKTSGLDWDVGALYYSYPGSDSSLNYDYWEAKGGLSHAFDNIMFSPTVGVEVYYSPEFFGKTGDAWYTNGSVGVTLPMDIGLNFAVGYQSIDKGTDYTDWKIGVSKEYAGLGFDLSYTDTDLDETQCGNNICDAKAVFTISKSL